MYNFLRNFTYRKQTNRQFVHYSLVNTNAKHNSSVDVTIGMTPADLNGYNSFLISIRQTIHCELITYTPGGGVGPGCIGARLNWALIHCMWCLTCNESISDKFQVNVCFRNYLSVD